LDLARVEVAHSHAADVVWTEPSLDGSCSAMLSHFFYSDSVAIQTSTGMRLHVHHNLDVAADLQ